MFNFLIFLALLISSSISSSTSFSSGPLSRADLIYDQTMALGLIASGATVLHQEPASLSVGLGHGLLLNGLDVVGGQLGQPFDHLSRVVPVAHADGGGDREAVLLASWCHWWCCSRSALAAGAGGVNRIVSRSDSGSGGVVCIVVISSAIVVSL